MQEHIRRAHPAYYISKLPATEESFALMINTPPSERPRESTGQGVTPVGPSSLPRPCMGAECRELTTSPPQPPVYGHERNALYAEESSSPATPRNVEEYHAGPLLPAASAAAALAQLQAHKPESDWDSEPVCLSRPFSSVPLPPPPSPPATSPGAPDPAVAAWRRLMAERRQCPRRRCTTVPTSRPPLSCRASPR